MKVFEIIDIKINEHINKLASYPRVILLSQRTNQQFKKEWLTVVNALQKGFENRGEEFMYKNIPIRILLDDNIEIVEVY